MALKIKTIRGRQYRYFDVSQRVNGKVVTKSTYLGPLHPKRRRGGGLVISLAPLNVALFAAYFAGKAMQGKLKTRTYRDKPSEPVSVHRARQVAQKAVEGLDRKYGIDKTNAEAWHASRARLPKEMFDEYERAKTAAWKAVHVEQERQHPPAAMSPDMKDFVAQVERARAEQAGRSIAAKGEATAADEGEAKG